MNELPCMNCKKPVPSTDGEIFAEVFICKACHEAVTHFWLKLDQELRYLLVMAKESIRLALIEGKFNLPEGPSGSPTRRSVLEEILRMEESRERKENSWRSAPTPSTANTSPAVAQKAAAGSEDSGTR